jgi:hypothetical protein
MFALVTRIIAITLVNTMATHGVRRSGCTNAKGRGMIRSLAIP